MRNGDRIKECIDALTVAKRKTDAGGLTISQLIDTLGYSETSIRNILKLPGFTLIPNRWPHTYYYDGSRAISDKPPTRGIKANPTAGPVITLTLATQSKVTPVGFVIEPPKYSEYNSLPYKDKFTILSAKRSNLVIGTISKYQLSIQTLIDAVTRFKEGEEPIDKEVFSENLLKLQQARNAAYQLIVGINLILDDPRMESPEYFDVFVNPNNESTNESETV